MLAVVRVASLNVSCTESRKLAPCSGAPRSQWPKCRSRPSVILTTFCRPRARLVSLLLIPFFGKGEYRPHLAPKKRISHEIATFNPYRGVRWTTEVNRPRSLAFGE